MPLLRTPFYGINYGPWDTFDNMPQVAQQWNVWLMYSLKKKGGGFLQDCRGSPQGGRGLTASLRVPYDVVVRRPEASTLFRKAMTYQVATPKPPAPSWYTTREAKVWQWGWIAGWQTSEPAYLPAPGVVFTEQEAKVWTEGRDYGFFSRHRHI